MFTVTDIVGRTCGWRSEPAYKSYLQDAFQRIQMDMGTVDFATFVMDELNEETIKKIKAACHDFTVHGDFVGYKNLYQGVLTENSLYSQSRYSTRGLCRRGYERLSAGQDS